ncbi:PREDICTED: fatty-acid-binding protein 1 [Populus euphratica]|uniref:Fatty-acid-binding protein 1 n=1 Tax=Populus euphratica TaxID=75702 RepID=A0AAJ6UBM6_POPEU|nr:PREDICTED: fatty-acid-binding protein 1 [Populus euphratica]
MVSLRFPFLFSQPKKHPNGISRTITSRSFSATTTTVACALAAGATAFAGIAATRNSKNPKQDNPFIQNALNLLFSNHLLAPWASLSLADPSPSVVETKTGAVFPSVIFESRRLLGIGLRKKIILGLKHIDVYAFGVYADVDEVRKVLSEKYGKLSVSELKESKEFKEDLMGGDIGMTVRLQIVYSKLSIRSVRSAFEESVGSRLQNFGEPNSKQLLQRFTSQFKDEYKIPRGSVIELSREQGHVLRTTIDGKEVGSIQSKLLCRSILDLYIGEDPFDKEAKEDIESKFASLLQVDH